ncbi:hypothetical protein DL770_004588 [Monosporascus sp. CRB-9-2]|nr:hypothetical protein DL770_004588 [Monosporascus sp. CRB-9-2]
MRRSSAQIERLIKDFVIECGTREDVFRLVDVVYQSLEDDIALDPERRKLLTKERRHYAPNGLMLSDAEVEASRLASIRKRINVIESQFLRNLDEENLCLAYSRRTQGCP